MVIGDVTDDDYSAMVLAKDLKERYRWVEMTPFFHTVDQALAAAPEVVDRIYAGFDKLRTQGDEKGKSIDFHPRGFEGKLNLDFAMITAMRGTLRQST